MFSIILNWINDIVFVHYNKSFLLVEFCFNLFILLYNYILFSEFYLTQIYLCNSGRGVGYRTPKRARENEEERVHT